MKFSFILVITIIIVQSFPRGTMMK